MTITYSNNNLNHNQAVSLSLDKGAVIDLVPPATGVDIRVESGSLWVTQEGDSSDHFVGPGQSFVANGHGLVVLQALSCADFRLPAHQTSN